MTVRLNFSSFLTCDYIDKSQCDIGICGMEIFHFAIFDYYQSQDRALNMGPAYLPHIMNGDLDFWIRMTLLGVGVGLGIWISIAVWSLWLILCYFHDLIRRH